MRHIFIQYIFFYKRVYRNLYRARDPRIADVVASWNLSAGLVSPSTTLGKNLFGPDYEYITE